MYSNISKINSELHNTDWVELDSNMPIKWRCHNGIITIVCNGALPNVLSTIGWNKLGNLPTDYIPRYSIITTVFIDGMILNCSCLQINSNGDVNLYVPTGKTAEYVFGSVSF